MLSNQKSDGPLDLDHVPDVGVARFSLRLDVPVEDEQSRQQPVLQQLRSSQVLRATSGNPKSTSSGGNNGGLTVSTRRSGNTSSAIPIPLPMSPSPLSPMITATTPQINAAAAAAATATAPLPPLPAARPEVHSPLASPNSMAPQPGTATTMMGIAPLPDVLGLFRRSSQQSATADGARTPVRNFHEPSSADDLDERLSYSRKGSRRRNSSQYSNAENELSNSVSDFAEHLDRHSLSDLDQGLKINELNQFVRNDLPIHMELVTENAINSPRSVKSDPLVITEAQNIYTTTSQSIARNTSAHGVPKGGSTSAGEPTIVSRRPKTQANQESGGKDSKDRNSHADTKKNTGNEKADPTKKPLIPEQQLPTADDLLKAPNPAQRQQQFDETVQLMTVALVKFPLRFNWEPLEEMYRTHMIETRGGSHFALLLLFLAIVCLLVTDLELYSREIAYRYRYLRLCAQLPLIVGFYFFTCLPDAYIRYHQLSNVLFSFLLGLSFIAMSIVGESPSHGPHMLYYFVVFMFLELRIVWSALVTIILLILFLASTQVFETSPSSSFNLATSAAFLIITWVVSALAAYYTEYFSRLQYLKLRKMRATEGSQLRLIAKLLPNLETGDDSNAQHPVDSTNSTSTSIADKAQRPPSNGVRLDRSDTQVTLSDVQGPDDVTLQLRRDYSETVDNDLDDAPGVHPPETKGFRHVFHTRESRGEVHDNAQSVPKISHFTLQLTRQHRNVSVLFTDIMGFTSFAVGLTPAELADQLNELYTAFDRVLIALRVLKIETIGDAYFCAAGLDQLTQKNHAELCIVAGMLMLHELKLFSRRLELRSARRTRIELMASALKQDRKLLRLIERRVGEHATIEELAAEKKAIKEAEKASSRSIAIPPRERDLLYAMRRRYPLDQQTWIDDAPELSDSMTNDEYLDDVDDGADRTIAMLPEVFESVLRKYPQLPKQLSSEPPPTHEIVTPYDAALWLARQLRGYLPDDHVFHHYLAPLESRVLSLKVREEHFTYRKLMLTRRRRQIEDYLYHEKLRAERDTPATSRNSQTKPPVKSTEATKAAEVSKHGNMRTTIRFATPEESQMPQVSVMGRRPIKDLGQTLAEPSSLVVNTSVMKQPPPDVEGRLGTRGNKRSSHAKPHDRARKFHEKSKHLEVPMELMGSRSPVISSGDADELAVPVMDPQMFRPGTWQDDHEVFSNREVASQEFGDRGSAEATDPDDGSEDLDDYDHDASNAEYDDELENGVDLHSSNGLESLFGARHDIPDEGETDTIINPSLAEALRSGYNPHLSNLWNLTRYHLPQENMPLAESLSKIDSSIPSTSTTWRTLGFNPSITDSNVKTLGSSVPDQVSTPLTGSKEDELNSQQEEGVAVNTKETGDPRDPLCEAARTIQAALESVWDRIPEELDNILLLLSSPVEVLAKHQEYAELRARIRTTFKRDIARILQLTRMQAQVRQHVPSEHSRELETVTVVSTNDPTQRTTATIDCAGNYPLTLASDLAGPNVAESEIMLKGFYANNNVAPLPRPLLSECTLLGQLLHSAKLPNMTPTEIDLAKDAADLLESTQDRTFIDFEIQEQSRYGNEGDDYCDEPNVGKAACMVRDQILEHITHVVRPVVEKPPTLIKKPTWDPFEVRDIPNDPAHDPFLSLFSDIDARFDACDLLWLIRQIRCLSGIPLQDRQASNAKPGPTPEDLLEDEVITRLLMRRLYRAYVRLNAKQRRTRRRRQLRSQTQRRALAPTVVEPFNSSALSYQPIPTLSSWRSYIGAKAYSNSTDQGLWTNEQSENARQSRLRLDLSASAELVAKVRCAANDAVTHVKDINRKRSRGVTNEQDEPPQLTSSNPAMQLRGAYFRDVHSEIITDAKLAATLALTLAGTAPWSAIVTELRNAAEKIAKRECPQSSLEEPADDNASEYSRISGLFRNYDDEGAVVGDDEQSDGGSEDEEQHSPHDLQLARSPSKSQLSPPFVDDPKVSIEQFKATKVSRDTAALENIDEMVACKLLDVDPAIFQLDTAFVPRTAFQRWTNERVLRMRVGVHTGSVIAGVIGEQVPRYHLFGPTVSEANNMESSGKPDYVHITSATKESLDKSQSPDGLATFFLAEPPFQYQSTELQRATELSTVPGSPVTKARSTSGIQNALSPASPTLTPSSQLQLPVMQLDSQDVVLGQTDELDVTDQWHFSLNEPISDQMQETTVHAYVPIPDWLKRRPMITLDPAIGVIDPNFAFSRLPLKVVCWNEYKRYRSFAAALLSRLDMERRQLGLVLLQHNPKVSSPVHLAQQKLLRNPNKPRPSQPTPSTPSSELAPTNSCFGCTGPRMQPTSALSKNSVDSAVQPRAVKALVPLKLRRNNMVAGAKAMRVEELLGTSQEMMIDELIRRILKGHSPVVANKLVACLGTLSAFAFAHPHDAQTTLPALFALALASAERVRTWNLGPSPSNDTSDRETQHGNKGARGPFGDSTPILESPTLSEDQMAHYSSGDSSKTQAHEKLVDLLVNLLPMNEFRGYLAESTPASVEETCDQVLQLLHNQLAVWNEPKKSYLSLADVLQLKKKVSACVDRVKSNSHAKPTSGDVPILLTCTEQQVSKQTKHIPEELRSQEERELIIQFAAFASLVFRAEKSDDREYLGSLADISLEDQEVGDADEKEHLDRCLTRLRRNPSSNDLIEYQQTQMDIAASAPAPDTTTDPHDHTLGTGKECVCDYWYRRWVQSLRFRDYTRGWTTDQLYSSFVFTPGEVSPIQDLNDSASCQSVSMGGSLVSSSPRLRSESPLQLEQILGDLPAIDSANSFHAGQMPLAGPDAQLLLASEDKLQLTDLPGFNPCILADDDMSLRGEPFSPKLRSERTPQHKYCSVRTRGALTHIVNAVERAYDCIRSCLCRSKPVTQDTNSSLTRHDERYRVAGNSASAASSGSMNVNGGPSNPIEPEPNSPHNDVSVPIQNSLSNRAVTPMNTQVNLTRGVADSEKEPRSPTLVNLKSSETPVGAARHIARKSISLSHGIATPVLRGHSSLNLGGNGTSTPSLSGLRRVNLPPSEQDPNYTSNAMQPIDHAKEQGLPQPLSVAASYNDSSAASVSLPVPSQGEVHGSSLLNDSYYLEAGSNSGNHLAANGSVLEELHQQSRDVPSYYRSLTNYLEYISVCGYLSQEHRLITEQHLTRREIMQREQMLFLVPYLKEEETELTNFSEHEDGSPNAKYSYLVMDCRTYLRKKYREGRLPTYIPRDPELVEKAHAALARLGLVNPHGATDSEAQLVSPSSKSKHSDSKSALLKTRLQARAMSARKALSSKLIDTVRLAIQSSEISHSLIPEPKPEANQPPAVHGAGEESKAVLTPESTLNSLPHSPRSSDSVPVRRLPASKSVSNASTNRGKAELSSAASVSLGGASDKLGLAPSTPLLQPLSQSLVLSPLPASPPRPRPLNIQGRRNVEDLTPLNTPVPGSPPSQASSRPRLVLSSPHLSPLVTVTQKRSQGDRLNHSMRD